MRKVLIVSHSEDGTAQLLADRFDEIGSEYHLIDLSQFPKLSVASISYQDGVKFRYREDDKGFSYDDVKSIWWRRPHGKFREGKRTGLHEYMRAESDAFVMSLFYLLPHDVFWVSDPDRTRVANNKPLQLAIAQQVGMRIPRTLISNDPEEVRRFLGENSSRMPLIMKPVGSSFFRAPEEEGGNQAIYTKVLDPEQVLQNVTRVRNCPVIFQEALVEKLDLRATVVGDAVFTVSISHERDLGAGESNVDWRHHKLERVYSRYELPIEIQRKCTEVVKALGLEFGVIDLCISKGQYYFFEVNPQGQWVPSELVAGLPISKTLAELLVRGNV